MLIVAFLAAGNAAFWLLILNRRARRYLVRGWVRRYGTGSAKEDIVTGDVVTFCVAVVFEMAFILLTVAAALQLLGK